MTADPIPLADAARLAGLPTKAARHLIQKDPARYGARKERRRVGAGAGLTTVRDVWVLDPAGVEELRAAAAASPGRYER